MSGVTDGHVVDSGRGEGTIDTILTCVADDHITDSGKGVDALDTSTPCPAYSHVVDDGRAIKFAIEIFLSTIKPSN